MGHDLFPAGLALAALGGAHPDWVEGYRWGWESGEEDAAGGQPTFRRILMRLLEKNPAEIKGGPRFFFERHAAGFAAGIEAYRSAHVKKTFGYGTEQK